MRQISHRMAKVAFLAATGVALAFSVGCDDSHRADKRVAETIRESRLARLKEGGAPAAEDLLKKAASESEASAATRAHVKSLLGNAQMDAAN